MSRPAQPVWETFPPETHDAFLDVKTIGDTIDMAATLPDQIDLTYPQEKMRRNFALCADAWQQDVQRKDLLRLIHILLRDKNLSEDKRKQYKYMRQAYKHLRFALILYDERHSVPWLFNLVIVLMGELQDAFRNDRPIATRGYGLIVRALLAKPIWSMVRRRIYATRLDSAEGFLAYRRAQIHRLATMLSHELLTGREFHNIRKIISQHNSFYYTCYALEHKEHDYKMCRYLGVINKLMGDLHDVMVAKAVSGEQAYQTPLPLDPDIRARLEQLVAHYPLEGSPEFITPAPAA